MHPRQRGAGYRARKTDNPPFVFPQEQSMVHVAIVGLGNIGNVHAGCYKKMKDVKLVAVCDIIKEKADKASKQYECQAFYSVDELLKSGIKLDAVSVATAGKENGGD